MSNSKMLDLLPQEHIRNLYTKTQNGKLAITYYPENGEPSFDLTYDVDWTEADAEALAKKCESLIKTLNRLAQIHDDLLDENKRIELLTEEELEVWDTFVRLFKPFEVPESVIFELYKRGEFDELSDEENALLERHYEWQEAECLERLPYNRTSPTKYIISALHYELSIYCKRPENEIKDYARILAEEMILYYFNKKKD